MVADSQAGKVAAARYAVEKFVRLGLTLALGTGSTAGQAVRALRERWPTEPFDCVASSRETEELARSLHLPTRPLRADDTFDLMLDGADEVAPDLSLTKGGGGALFREKLLAQLSREVVIMVDPSKLVDHLGQRAPIPVEVVPYARPVLERRLAREGFEVAARTRPDGRPFLTDNGNEVLDLTPTAAVKEAAALDRALRSWTGVVETGVFVNVASRVVIGGADGRVQERFPPTRRTG